MRVVCINEKVMWCWLNVLCTLLKWLCGCWWKSVVIKLSASVQALWQCFIVVRFVCTLMEDCTTVLHTQLIYINTFPSHPFPHSTITGTSLKCSIASNLTSFRQHTFVWATSLSLSYTWSYPLTPPLAVQLLCPPHTFNLVLWHS